MDVDEMNYSFRDIFEILLNLKSFIAMFCWYKMVLHYNQLEIIWGMTFKIINVKVDKFTIFDEI